MLKRVPTANNLQTLPAQSAATAAASKSLTSPQNRLLQEKFYGVMKDLGPQFRAVSIGTVDSYGSTILVVELKNSQSSSNDSTTKSP